jgi:hypothetical protein
MVLKVDPTSPSKLCFNFFSDPINKSIAMPTNVPIFAAPSVEIPPNYPYQDLDDDQKALVSELKELIPDIFSTLTGVPLDGEKEWADDSCLIRYLKASKWDLAVAGKLLYTNNLS